MSVKPSDGIGERIAKYRRLAGLSAQQLSDKIGGMLSRSVIANIENGRKTDLTVDQLIALSWALDVPPVALALPLDQPYRFIRIVDSDEEVVTERAIVSALWFIDQGELPMSEKEKARTGPGRVLAKTTVRTLQKYGRALLERNILKDKQAQAESELEVNHLEDELKGLGVDLNVYKVDE